VKASISQLLKPFKAYLADPAAFESSVPGEDPATGDGEGEMGLPAASAPAEVVEDAPAVGP
jgi:hypothetical protein